LKVGADGGRLLVLRISARCSVPGAAEDMRTLSILADLPPDEGFGMRAEEPDPAAYARGFPNRYGFSLVEETLQIHHRSPARLRYAQVPWWSAVVALPTARVTWVWLKRRHRARSRGLCPACGYDMRASTDRRPECGAAPLTAGVA
jgi:hypothetical protein